MIPRELPPTGETTRTGDDRPAVPESIGDFRIIRKIGEGGMGIVYEAEQQHPRRPVALKVIRGSAYVDQNHIRMFQREAQTLARLRHPSIAAIYESGRTADGQHFFAMELVRGQTLTEHLETTPWGREEGQRTAQARPSRRAIPVAETHYRLRLFRCICDAVAYAHQRGVIHRDLKPSNILVVRDSAQRGATPSLRSQSDSSLGPEIKILDFGLARITDTDVAAPTIVTEIGNVQGTIPYMSPEQMRGNPDEIDVRTDLYSLGVILYEMLAGRLPYDVRGAPLLTAARVICETAPESLKRMRGLDADIETIVFKALEKEPSRRYQAASALAEDVDRYLANQPILARPPSTVYQFRKLVARHKAPFVSAVTLTLLLAGFAMNMAVQARRVARERDRANQEAEAARQVSDFLVGLFEVSDPNEAKGNTITAREILDQGAEKIARELKDQPLVQARLMDTMGNVYRSLGLYTSAGPLLEKALAIREGVLGGTSLDAARSLTSLARLRIYEGRLDEALSFSRQAADIREKALGADHVDVAWSLYYVGTALCMKGDVERARPPLQRALEIFERRLGPDHMAVAWTLNDLGNTYLLDRDFPAARALYERALRIKEKNLGRDHPDVSGGMNNLAISLIEMGDYAAAKPLIERAVQIAEKSLGPDHPETAKSRHTLGELLRRAGRTAEARPLLEAALSSLERVWSSDHPDFAEVLASLALVLQDLGETAAAEAYFKRAMAIHETKEGVYDPLESEMLKGYAELLRKSGRPAEAERIEDRATAARERLQARVQAGDGAR